MKNWRIISELKPNQKFTDVLLENRGIVTPEQKKLFLNPPSVEHFLTLLPETFITSLNEAKDIITKSIENSIPIIVHGDYDADGICATAILYKTLKFDLKYARSHHFIPNRFDHGYGLSRKSIDAVIASLGEQYGSDQKYLFITVDSGITSTEEVVYIKSLGHQVIITDHHQKPPEIPKADCLVWHDEIVGSSVAWLLSKHLGSTDPQSVALAAIATVTDLFPLVGLNRSIVKEGLQVLNNNPPRGIKQLLAVSGRRDAEVTTYDIGWVLGPRLNATGRIVDASQSLKLLIADSDDEALGFAQGLNDVNTQRQDKTVEMFEMISVSDDKATMPKIIVSSHPDYHEGIIGLVAARLAQKYYRPSIVISLAETYGKGSVRSVPGIDIISFLRNFNDMFVSLGGHPMAAGFTILKENIPTLQEKIVELSNLEISDSLLVPVLDIDLKIPLDLVSLGFCAEVSSLKPFGVGNNEPVFMSENVGVSALNIVGKEQTHLSLRLFSGSEFYKAIFFNGADRAKNLTIGDRVDIAYMVKESEFNGKKYVDLIVKDLRKSNGDFSNLA